MKEVDFIPQTFHNIILKTPNVKHFKEEFPMLGMYVDNVISLNVATSLFLRGRWEGLTIGTSYRQSTESRCTSWISLSGSCICITLGLHLTL